MADMDKDRIKFIILGLEADGAAHDGAEIDAYIAKQLDASPEELAELHPKSKRGVFANHIDWVKANLTEQKLHERIGELNGQNVYRITPKGRSALADDMRREDLGWMDLNPQQASEADIQRYVANWNQKPVGTWSHVGAPAWLQALHPRAANDYCDCASLGYSFRPDIVGESNGISYVLELKCAYKYEPIALAEALHHAHVLSCGMAQPPAGLAAPFIPVLVTQYNAWLRSALAFLRLKGLQAGSIKYVEFTSLVSSTGEKILWFDEPFAPLAPCPPPLLPIGLSTGSKYWYRVSDADTWIAVDDVLHERPALWTVPYLMLTVDRANARILTWHGGPTGLGRYLLWRRGANPQPLAL